MNSEDHVILQNDNTVPRLHPDESDMNYFLKVFLLPEITVHSSVEPMKAYNSVDRVWEA